MDQRQSYCLAYRQDDFSEPSNAPSNTGAYEILYVVPANDNSPNGYSLWSFGWLIFMRRLLRCTKLRHDLERL
jgi:hypothetical protein